MDDRDNLSGSYNNFLNDTLLGGTNHASRNSGRTYSVYKYTGVNGNIDDVPPLTRGPNQSCPSPLLPLTTNRTNVMAAINGMSHWYGGGTNNNEGVAWGWRVLSPTAPFTEGKAYGQARKIMVVMSDGRNAIVDNPNSDQRSDLTAYGHLELWQNGSYRNAVPAAARIAPNNKNQLESHLNARMALTCNNAKLAGIEIYTVLFQEPDSDTRTLFENCATDKDKAYLAEDAEELAAAFDDISDSIGELRITR
jgi:hypothetical protein